LAGISSARTRTVENSSSAAKQRDFLVIPFSSMQDQAGGRTAGPKGV
jgi:hypothetical protein